MSDNFSVPGSLPHTDCDEDDFYELIKTIVPTSELVNSRGLEISAGKIALRMRAPAWVKVGDGLTFEDFAAAALTYDIELFTLPAGGVIHGVMIKHSEAFAGGSISAYTLSVGIVGSLTKYAGAFDVFQAIGETVFQLASTVGAESFAEAGVSIRAAATSVGDNLDQASAGEVDIYALYSAVL